MLLKTFKSYFYHPNIQVLWNAINISIQVNVFVSRRLYSQVEGLIELGAPVVALGLGSKLPLLVSEVRTDQVHLNERTEHATGNDPLQVVCGYHWKYKIKGV